MSQTVQQALDELTRLHPKKIDLGLERIERVLKKLGNPHNFLPPTVHIAGTNGKGSTQAMIRAGLEQTGAKVHAYTSPHLARFHERIRLAGDLISEDALTAVLDRCYEANNGDPITYFEITTVAGLLVFAETPADYCLLEVGLGGRLDATNVISDPAATVITPVDLDHQQGPQHDESIDVIERIAARAAAPLHAHGQHWHVSTERGRLIYQDEVGLLDLPLPNLPGPHQIMNAGAAIATLRLLGQDEAACEAAVTHAYWPARMERLTKGALVDLAAPAELWLDGGHNPAAGRALAATMKDLPPRPTHLICGMLNTKDIGGYLAPLADVVESLHAVSIPGETNTMPAKDTAAAAQKVGLTAQVATDVQSAIADIVATAPNARILICGSLYLAGHVMRENET